MLPLPPRTVGRPIVDIAQCGYTLVPSTTHLEVREMDLELDGDILASLCVEDDSSPSNLCQDAQTAERRPSQQNYVVRGIAKLNGAVSNRVDSCGEGGASRSPRLTDARSPRLTVANHNEQLFASRAGLLTAAPFGLACFIAFSLRILVMPFAWATYIPVVSPVFGSGNHWNASRTQGFAISAHILSGVFTLICGLGQIDVSVRRSWPSLHRLMGRLYIVAGIVMVASLRELRATTGGFARPGDGGSVAMRLFVDAASLAWLCSTLIAWFQIALRRNVDLHRKWAVTSLAFALTPVAQRIVLTTLVPFAMISRLVFDAAVHGVPFWRSSWGRAPATLLGRPAAPCVLSLDGYGVAENALFAVSAWAGLFKAAHLAYIFAWMEPHEDFPGDNSVAGSRNDLINDFSIVTAMRIGLSDGLPSIAATGQGAFWYEDTGRFSCRAKAISMLFAATVSVPIIIIGNAIITSFVAASWVVCLHIPGLTVATMTYVTKEVVQATFHLMA